MLITETQTVKQFSDESEFESTLSFSLDTDDVEDWVVVENDAQELSLSLTNWKKLVEMGNKIIIPKEEPKQETLEEALTAEEFFRNKIKENIEWEGEITLWKVPLNAELSMRWAKEYSDYVIKWQKENSYSEEEVKFMLYNCCESLEEDERRFFNTDLVVESIIKQFKNK